MIVYACFKLQVHESPQSISLDVKVQQSENSAEDVNVQQSGSSAEENHFQVGCVWDIVHSCLTFPGLKLLIIMPDISRPESYHHRGCVPRLAPPFSQGGGKRSSIWLKRKLTDFFKLDSHLTTSLLLNLKKYKVRSQA